MRCSSIPKVIPKSVKLFTGLNSFHFQCRLLDSRIYATRPPQQFRSIPNRLVFHRGYCIPKELTLEQIKNTYQSNNPVEVGNVLKRLLKEKPQDAQVVVKEFLDANERDKAMKFCDDLVQTDPSSFHAHFYKGCLHLANKQAEEALVSLNQAEQFVHQHPEEFIRLMHMKVQADVLMKDYDSAITELEKALTKDPQYTESFVNLMRLLILQDRHEEAQSKFVKFELDMKKTSPVILFELSKVASVLGFHKAAAAAASHVLMASEYGKQNPSVKLSLAKYLWLSDQPQHSIQFLQELVHSSPYDVSYLWALTCALDDFGLKKEALPLLKNLQDLVQVKKGSFMPGYFLKDVYSRIANHYSNQPSLPDEDAKRLQDALKGLTTVEAVEYVPWYTVSLDH